MKMESNKEIKSEGTKRAESKVRITDSPKILSLARFVRLAVALEFTHGDLSAHFLFWNT